MIEVKMNITLYVDFDDDIIKIEIWKYCIIITVAYSGFWLIQKWNVSALQIEKCIHIHNSMQTHIYTSKYKWM